MASPEKDWTARVYAFLHTRLAFLWYLMKLSAVFLLFSLPVITIFAAYGAAMDCISDAQRNGYRPIFRQFWNNFKADGLKSSAVCAVCGLVGLAFFASGTYYYVLTVGSALQYLSAIAFAVLTFLDFSFLVCFFCVNSLVELPLRGLLSNTARYVFLSVPTNLGLLLTLYALLLLICIKQFLLIFSPLWLCLYGGLTFVSHKRGIRHYMTAA